MKKLIKAFITSLVVLLVFSSIVPLKAEDEKVIRVGYIDYGSFIECDKNGNYSGYGVEYLAEIAKRTNWQYEYVYDTWENCLEMLRNGEIDFLGTAQKTPEREDIYAFANIANGIEQTVLYTRLDSTDLYYNDYENFDGKKVGLLVNSFQTEFFEQYATTHNFSFEPVYLTTELEMEEALNSGKVDIMVGGSLALHTDLKVIGKEGADAFYFMTYKGNEAKLAQLNEAMAEIQNERPYFSQDLTKEYYGSSVITSQPQLTRQEAEYLQKAKTIRVGCLYDCYPISRWNEKTKKPEGIAIDLMEKMAQDIDLKIKYVPVAMGDSPSDYLQDDKIDIMLPMTKTFYQNDIILTDTLIEENMAAIMRQGEVFQPEKEYSVAFVKDFLNAKNIINKNLDCYTAIECDSIDDCLKAVRDGFADIYFDNYYIGAYRLKSPYYSNLQENYGHTFKADYCLGGQEDDMVLISILNKSISALDSNHVKDVIGIHTINNNYDYTFGETIYENRYEIMMISLLFITLIGAFLIVNLVQRKNVKAIALKNQQLEKASRARQSFLSNMSHEIRTPLNGIKGSLDILNEREYDEQTKELLTMTTISTNHLLNLVNDILDMSKIENGKLELHKEYVSSEEIGSYLEAIVRPLADKKQIILEPRVKLTKYPYIYIDKSRWFQVCINLISNSIKYTDAGGHVIVSIQHQEIGDEEVEITFSVKDTGIGMSEEFIEKAMEPFSQENNEIAKFGTGLGLAITKSLVSLMGGSLTLESKVGQGTKATIIIQTKAKLEIELDAKKEVQKEMGTIKNKHLLIVEDNAINRRIATMQGEAFGFTVDQAVNGQEAVELFNQSSPGYYSMILMDIMMPVMDGIMATKQIRKLPRDDATKVIIVAMSANAYVDDIHKSIESGMNYHLSKPFNKSEIRKIFETVTVNER